MGCEFICHSDEFDGHFDKLYYGSRAKYSAQPYNLLIKRTLFNYQAKYTYRGYGFLKPFKQLTQDYYRSGLEEVDFIHATEEARLTINKWVEQQTQEKIQDLF